MFEHEDVVERRMRLLSLAEESGNVSNACRIVGYSRDSFYRFKSLYVSGGPEALRNVSRKKPILKNRVAPEIEHAVVEMASQYPRLGQIRVCRELEKQNIKVSPGGVRSIWLRHGLETRSKRLKARDNRQSLEQQPTPIGMSVSPSDPITMNWPEPLVPEDSASPA